MAGPAKIQLLADVQGLKQKVEEAKKLLSGIGSTKVDPSFSKSLKESLMKELGEAAKSTEADIAKLQDKLKKMGEAGDKAFNPANLKKALSTLSEYERRLKSIQAVQSQIGGGGGTPGGKGGGESGGGGGLAGLANLIPGGGKAISLLLGGAGATAILNRQMEIAQERLKVRALTGGEVGSTGSALGFTEGERRQRTQSIASEIGRNMDKSEIDRMLTEGERAERMHGVTSDTQAALIGATRRAGGDESKVFEKTQSTAFEAGLRGSRVTEFLQSMTQSLGQLSEGVNIDESSLIGFAGALSTMDFFKSDPARAARAAQTLNQTFQSGDRFQEAMAARAIRSAGGDDMSPASVELRRRAGLFGGSKKGNTGLEGLGPEFESARKALTIGSGELINNMIDGIIKGGAGMSGDEQLIRFQSATGLDFGAAKDIFAKRKQGIPLDAVDKKALKEGAKTPQERLNDTFKGVDSELANLKGTMSALNETIGGQLVGPVASIADSLIKMVRGDETESKEFGESFERMSPMDMLMNPSKTIRASLSAIPTMLTRGGSADERMSPEELGAKYSSYSGEIKKKKAIAVAQSAPYSMGGGNGTGTTKPLEVSFDAETRGHIKAMATRKSKNNRVQPSGAKVQDNIQTGTD